MDRAGLVLFVLSVFFSVTNVFADEDFDQLTRKAYAKDAVAQYKLGLLYQFGRGVVRDYTEAMAWFQTAADQDYPLAQYAIARMYYLGQGVKWDFNKAVEWYQKAAEQDYPQAQYSLGTMYASGRGIEQDYAEAYFWYGVSAANGHEDALHARSVFETLITAEEIEDARNRIRELRKLIPPKRVKELKRIIAEKKGTTPSAQ